MHHALEIQELLFGIFHHCPRPDLFALARTCHAFKEPALDVLWGELAYLSPLVRCLSKNVHGWSHCHDCYSFRSPFTQPEWDTLQSYTRRIRSITAIESPWGIDSGSIRRLAEPPTGEPIFPKLRRLSFGYTDKYMALLLLPLPSLVSMDIRVCTSHLLEDSLKSAAKMSPNLRTLSIRDNFAFSESGGMRKIDSNFICHWRNLQTVTCPKMFLDANTLLYLSCMPSLTRLSFKVRSTLPDQIASSDLPLPFPNLNALELYSESLDPISQLLSRTRPTAIADFHAFIQKHPPRISRQDVSAFLISVQASGIGETVQELWLVGGMPLNMSRGGDLGSALNLEDLQPLATFRNLRRINFNARREMNLGDRQLLALASGWPHLEQLFINTEWDWGSRGGMTPNGLLQLLQRCPSLTQICLALDTRSFTKCPPPPASLVPRISYIDVLDSLIAAESVPAVAAFLAGIVPRPDFLFRAWSRYGIPSSPYNGVYWDRWDDVYRRARKAVRRRS